MQQAAQKEARIRKPVGLTEEEAALWSQPFKDPEMQMPVGETDPDTYYECLIDMTAQSYFANAGDDPDFARLADELDARLNKTGVEGLTPPSPELWSLVVTNLRARANGVHGTVDDRSEDFRDWLETRGDSDKSAPLNFEEFHAWSDARRVARTSERADVEHTA